MRRLVLAMALLAPGFAQPGLLGTQATGRYDFSGGGSSLSGTGSATAGPGIELACPGQAGICIFPTAPDSRTVDLGDTTLRYAFSDPPNGFNPAAVSAMTFGALDGGTPIIGFTLATDLAAVDAGRTSFTASSVTVDPRDVPLPGPTNFFEIGLVFAAVEVPAPAAILSFAAGLLGRGLARRRAGCGAPDTRRRLRRGVLSVSRRAA